MRNPSQVIEIRGVDVAAPFGDVHGDAVEGELGEDAGRRSQEEPPCGRTVSGCALSVK